MCTCTTRTSMGGTEHIPDISSCFHQKSHLSKQDKINHFEITFVRVSACLDIVSHNAFSSALFRITGCIEESCLHGISNKICKIYVHIPQTTIFTHLQSIILSRLSPASTFNLHGLAWESRCLSHRYAHYLSQNDWFHTSVY